MSRHGLQTGFLPIVVAACVLAGPALWGADSTVLKFTGAGDLQALLEQVPAGGTLVCEQAEPLVVGQTLVIRKPMTLRGFKARLPEKLGKTVLMEVEARGVVLLDLEMHGNYDSVDQKHRAALLHIKAGDFRIERCAFFDGSKDGINVTPVKGAGDIVGGVIRDIRGFRMGRDLVSISGGNTQLVRNVTVENVTLKTGYKRGAVEVSDGSDNVVVRNVRAEDAVYAVDVQDHTGPKSPNTELAKPNTNVTLEDIVAENCKQGIRTANHPLGHANLTLKNVTVKNCREPILISNTKAVRVSNLTIANDTATEQPPIQLRGCEDVELQNVTIRGLKPGGKAAEHHKSTGVRIRGLSVNGAAVPD